MWWAPPSARIAGRITPDGVFSASKGWNFGGNGHFWIDARIVSAEGPDAAEIVSVDPEEEDPFGRRSVYERLIARGDRVDAHTLMLTVHRQPHTVTVPRTVNGKR